MGRTDVRRSRRLAAALALLLLAALVLLLVSRLLPARDLTWERLQRGEPLRIAIDPSFPPFDSLDGAGQMAGFDVDLARELGRRIGAPVQFQAIAFDGLVDAVIAGKADAVISAFPLDPRLTGDVRYSRPYFEAGLVLVAPAGSAIAGPDDLAGRTAAVEWGSLGDAWGREQGMTIARKETPVEALAAVAQGEADVAVVDAVTAALSSPPGLTIRTPPLQSDPYVIVLPLAAPRLAHAVDDALAAMLTDGTWQELASKYFPVAPLPPVE
ncbi:MAG: ABC transporter substrate-binding protein [Caldilineales bacterium]|nr:ABC transporter substrate-binding protein [Caldilineales bacterium]MCW5859672.1 amino acid ABC transporter substrate-binding protein [Caldilineales bacterium]